MKEKLDQLLFDCLQLFDSWHSDIAWSEWDQSVRDRLSTYLSDLKNTESQTKIKKDYFKPDEDGAM